MLFDQFLAEIKGSLKQYNSAGLIDDMDVYSYLIDALNELSILPTIRIETVLNVKNNTAKLPDGFKSMYLALKCEPYKVAIDEPEPDVLQDFYFYKVRELKNEDWNFCNPCEITESDTCVVEKTYLHNNVRANFYYKNLEPLSLKMTSHVKRTSCDKDSPNLSIKNTPHEISVNNKTIYANFKEGKIFMIYNGYEHDEDGFIIIPEESENIMKYLKASVKKNLMLNFMENSDATSNENTLYTLYATDEDKYYRRTVGEIKLKKVLNGMDNYRAKIKKEFAVYNFGEYSTNNKSNKIDFLVI